MSRPSARPDDAEGTSDDLFLGGRLTVRQPRQGHRSGRDAVMLAAACPARSGDSVADLGSGVGVAGLCVAARVALSRLDLVDIDEAVLALARLNLARNALSCESRVIPADLTGSNAAKAEAGLERESVDHVILNPPFYDPASFRVSLHEGRKRAHSGEAGTLDAWLNTGIHVVRQGGSLTLIHRADMLGDVLARLDGRVGALVVVPVHARADRPAIRIVVGGVRGRRSPLTLSPPLVLARDGGEPTVEADAVLREGGPIRLAPR